jgi:hypothetical protein
MYHQNFKATYGMGIRTYGIKTRDSRPCRFTLNFEGERKERREGGERRRGEKERRRGRERGEGEWGETGINEGGERGKGGRRREEGVGGVEEGEIGEEDIKLLRKGKADKKRKRSGRRRTG